jgi:hypothetical protein
MVFRNQVPGLGVLSTVAVSVLLSSWWDYTYQECILMPRIQTQPHRFLPTLSVIDNCTTLHLGIVGFNLLNTWLGWDDVVTIGPRISSGWWFCKALWPPLGILRRSLIVSPAADWEEGHQVGFATPSQEWAPTGRGCLLPGLIVTQPGPKG